jgi:hypothetical protein
MKRSNFTWRSTSFCISTWPWRIDNSHRKKGISVPV